MILDKRIPLCQAECFIKMVPGSSPFALKKKSNRRRNRLAGYSRVVQKLQFLNKFRLKQQSAEHFAFS
jgi:hypothetical protein